MTSAKVEIIWLANFTFPKFQSSEFFYYFFFVVEVVDAGANLGYFATYAGVLGCSVIAFEPQPRLIPIISTR